MHVYHVHAWYPEVRRSWIPLEVEVEQGTSYL